MVEKNTKTTFYLVRHAEAAGNINRVFQGSMNAELSENGHKQLTLLAERCKNFPVDVIYTSPLIRARKTAEAFNTYHNAPVIIDPRLVEIDGGEFEGKPWEQLVHAFPEQFAVWTGNHGCFEAPGGETVKAVQERMTAAFTDIAFQEKGKSIAIISHGCALRTLICFLKGLTLDEIKQVSWKENTAITKFTFENGRAVFEFENDSTHLGDYQSPLSGQSWWKKVEK